MEVIAAHVELEDNEVDADGSVVEYTTLTTLTLNEGDNLSIVLSKKGTAASHVWDYFGFLCNTSNDTVLDPTNVYCDICFRAKEVRRYGAKTSTGNLGSHLSKKHGIISTKCRGVELSFVKVKKQTTKNSEVMKFSRPIRMAGKKPGPASRLSREVGTWLVRDLLPLDATDGKGFSDFFRQHNIIQNDEKPVVSHHVLKDLYDSTTRAVQTELQNAPITLAVTFNSWTDNHRQLGYITYTVHWIDSNWKMKKIPLTTSYFPYPTTPTAIVEDFKDVQKEFGLMDHMHSFVATTCGSAVAREACEMLNFQQHVCMAHGLHNLLTRDLLEQLGHNELNLGIEKMTNIHKQIIYRFNFLQRHAQDAENLQNIAIERLLEYHAKLDDILENEDRADMWNDDDSLSIATTEITANGQAQIIQLKKKSCIRWHVLLDMINTYKTSRATINSVMEVLDNHELVCTDEEMEALTEFASILEVFKSTSEMLCGDEYAALNLSVLFRSAIIKRLQEDTDGNDMQMKARLILLENVDKWFPLNDINVCAALLDPSMRKLIAIEHYLAAKGMTNAQLVQNMVAAYGIAEESPITSADMNISSADSQPVWKRLKADYLKECTTTGPDTIESEIGKYFMFSTTDEEPLAWWKTNEHLFPQLSLMAKIFLGIPAISAPSHRAFSTAGILKTAKQSMLNPTTIRQVLFIHDNSELTSEHGKEKNVGVNFALSHGPGTVMYVGK